MSQQDFERTDQEVMDLVNGAASPESKQAADAIEKELNKPKTRSDYDKIAEECVSKVVVEELHRKWKRNTIIARSLCALAGIAAAVAMVIALKNPECVVHIANVTILIGGIAAALQVEKIVKLLRK